MPSVPDTRLQWFDEGLVGVPATVEQQAAAPAPGPRDVRDPALLAHMARKADERAALAAAQQQGNEARKWIDVGHQFRRAADVFAGRHTDEAGLQAELAAA